MIRNKNFLIVRYIVAVVLVSISLVQFSFAQNIPVKSKIIEKWKGEQYYMHFVNQDETVQILAKLYGVSNVDILKANPEIATGLQPGKVIRIPVNENSELNKQDQNIPQEGVNVKSISNPPQKVTQHDSTPYQFIHEVLPKETWYAIARHYKVPVKLLIDANPSVDTLKIGMNIFIPKVAENYKVVTEGYAEHTVQPQETLYGLAKKYNTTGQELLRLNPSLNEGLKAGQVIVVPAPESESELKIQVTDTSYTIHEVQKKETLYSISKQYGVNINDIIKSNPDYDGNLRKGDKLKIPALIKHVKPFARPDTVIMGRDVSQEAIRDYSKTPCFKTNDSRREYNIALMVPMRLEMVDSISVSSPSDLKTAAEYSSFDFIQFYEGAVIAADSLAKIGMNIRLHVYDVDYGNDINKTRRALNKPEMKSMDLIIGPFFAESFDLVAEFASQNKIPVVNPLSMRGEVIKGNEYIFKMQPSSWAQYTVLVNYLKTAHKNDNIIIVRRNQQENSSMAELIKNSFGQENSDAMHIKEVIYSSKGWSGISSSLNSSKNNFVLILTSDKAVLPALLRDLAEKRTTLEISILGLSDWENLELDYNYLIKLNTHFFNPWFVDYNNSSTKNFVRKFRSRYIAEPEIDKYAFLGYDATFFFLSALYNFGDGFTNCIEEYENPGLSNDLHFRKVPDGGYENCGTSVFKYTDFIREKLN